MLKGSLKDLNGAPLDSVAQSLNGAPLDLVAAAVLGAALSVGVLLCWGSNLVVISVQLQ